MSAQPSILLRNASVFDGHNEQLHEGKSVGIKNGRIEHFSSEPWQETPDQEIDLRGKTLMPGLIDAHFHAYAGVDSFPLVEELPLTYLAHSARNVLQAALSRGFTSVRDAAGADHGLWYAIESRQFIGPRLFFGGKALSQTGGHGDVRPSHAEACHCASMGGSLVQVVDGVDDVTVAAREIMRSGAHQIKIMASGGLASPSDPVWMSQYTEAEIKAIVAEAQRWRGYVMAHAYGADTIARAIRCGVRSIEHGNLIDEASARMVADAAAYVVPTLITYDPFVGTNEAELGASAAEDMGGLAEFKRAGLEAIETCRKVGVKLGFGTDLFGSMHRFQSQEFRMRAEVDTPFQILHSATAINAEIVQKPRELGCVAEGAIADLLVLDENPLENLAVLYREQPGIRMVMKEGELVHDYL
ncbi:amidohydrolase family protein [Luminiphilus sp.]|nr:amidohydrolase family protein [Luminiphilus sp.]MDA9722032.1 amidohydrolase family protein [Luminiphilus sp.]